MPNSRSAAKRLRQRKGRTLRNRMVKTSLKTQTKKVLKALDGGDVVAAETEFRTAAKKLDQAGAKGVIHPNSAARKKSRLQAAIKRVKLSGQEG